MGDILRVLKKFRLLVSYTGYQGQQRLLDFKRSQRIPDIFLEVEGKPYIVDFRVSFDNPEKLKAAYQSKIEK